MFSSREQDLTQTEGKPYWIKVDVDDGLYLLVEKVDRAPGALIDFSLATKKLRANNVDENGPGLTVKRSIYIISRELTSSFQGTRAFIAMFLLMQTDEGRHILHSPVFDMESFFWVLLFAILHPNRDELSNREKQVYKALVPPKYSDDYLTDVQAKFLALANLRPSDKTYKALPHLEPYKDLIEDLAELVNRYFDLPQRPNRPGTPVYTLEEEQEAIHNYIDAFERFLRLK